MTGKIVVRIVSALVLLAAIAGIAFFAFQAGVAKGSPVTMTAPSGESATVPYMYHGYEFGHTRFIYPFGFGFGCFGLLIPLFLFILAMKAFRFMMWGPRWGHMGHHRHGPWGRHWENGVPPMFDEWHKKAHGESTEEDKKE